MLFQSAINYMAKGGTLQDIVAIIGLCSDWVHYRTSSVIQKRTVDQLRFYRLISAKLSAVRISSMLCLLLTDKKATLKCHFCIIRCYLFYFQEHWILCLVKSTDNHVYAPSLNRPYVIETCT